MKMYYYLTYLAVPVLFKHVQSFLLSGCGQGIVVDVLLILLKVIGTVQALAETLECFCYFSK